MTQAEKLVYLCGDEQLHLAFIRGIVVVGGTNVDDAAATDLALGAVPEDWQKKRCERDGDCFHLTCMTKEDLQTLAANLHDDTLDWPEGTLQPDAKDHASIAMAVARLVSERSCSLTHVVLGPGKARDEKSEAAFLVVVWPAGDAVRRQLGLAQRDFHITLGFSHHDVHGRSKGVGSLVGGVANMPAAQAVAALARELIDAGVTESVQELADISMLAATTHEDSICEALILESMCLLAGLEKQPKRVLELAGRLLLLDSSNEVALRSRAFALFMLKRYQEAFPALEQARGQVHVISEEAERAVIEERVRKCMEICKKKLDLPEISDDTFERAFLEERQLKFPQTCHLKNMGAATKDDKLCDKTRQHFFCGSGRFVTVEEKIDGANVGISLDSNYKPRLQGRSKWITWSTEPQFSGLEHWLNEHSGSLCNLLARNQHVLFGEWCQCLHTVKYTKLPNYFIAFDIYDLKARRFLSRRSFHARLRDAAGPKIPAVPHITHCQFASMKEVEELLDLQATFGEGTVEGVYLRVDEAAPSDGESYLEDRCKLVRADFQQAIEDTGNFRGRGQNQIGSREFAEEYCEQSYIMADAAQTTAGAASTPATAAQNVTGAASSEATPAQDTAEGRGNYPSTPHLPFSPGVNDDDSLLADCAHLLGNEVVITEKLDGGNCCIKDGQVYARTHSHPATHASFSRIKDLMQTFSVDIGGVELYGENMTAVASIEYENLTSCFYLFGIRQDGEWLPWDDTLAWAERLQLPMVPVLYRGSFDSPQQLRECLERWAKEPSAVGANVCPEGFVVRRTHGFATTAFADSIAKYVRANHIQTSTTWKRTWKKAQMGDPLPARPLRTLGDPLRARLSNPRVRHRVPAGDAGEVELPRNFSFILDELAVSSTPKNRDQISAMGGLGISLIITLTEEQPLLAKWFENTGVVNMFVPVTNYEPPTVDQTDAIFDAIQEVLADPKKKLMVHCGGGKGRAGTVAACALLRYGTDSILKALQANSSAPFSQMQSDEVISYLRDARPGSIETKQQEKFVREYASLLWQRHAESSSGPRLIRTLSTMSEREEEALIDAELFESASSASGDAVKAGLQRKVKDAAAAKSLKARRAEKELEGLKKNVSKRAPKFIVMVGLAGAGKSTFSRALEDSGCWVRANQDDLKRKNYNELVSHTVPAVRQGKTHLVIDRCNVTQAERREVLDLLGSPKPSDVVCIFYDFPAADCKKRAAAREDHPTIKKGGGARIIDDQAKKLQMPKASEGFGVVEVVKSFDDADALLRRYGAEPPRVSKSAQVATPEQIAVAIVEEADAGPDVEEDQGAPSSDVALPDGFISWLREALQQELSLATADADSILDGIIVILGGADANPEALENAAELLVGEGASKCAEELPHQWGLFEGSK